MVPSQPSQELTGKFRDADLQVTRLGPSAFPELPRNIRRELERRGCTIPQVWEDRKPHNVIKGEFTRKGQTDWAVLCSLNRVSSILIFQNAMNVVSEDEVWLCYYSAFLLVSIRGFRLLRVWKEFGCMDKAFSLLEGAVIFPKCYTRIHEGHSQLLRRTLAESPQTESQLMMRAE